MTKIHSLLLVMAVMTACHTIDPEPDPEPEPEPAPAYAQILSRYESILDYTPWPARFICIPMASNSNPFH